MVTEPAPLLQAALTASPEYQKDRDRTILPPSLDKLQRLLEDKVLILHNSLIEDHESSDFEEHVRGGGVWRDVVRSQEVTSHLTELQKQTERELTTIQLQLCEIRGRRQQLNSELCDLEQKRRETEAALQRDPSLQTCTCVLRAGQELERSIAGRSALSERLVFQEQALSSLCSLLNQDLQRYKDEGQKLNTFTQNLLGEDNDRSEQEHHRLHNFTHSQHQLGMQGKNETEQSNNMATLDTHTGSSNESDGVNGHTGVISHTRSLSEPESSPLRKTEEEEQAWLTANKKAVASQARGSSSLTRSGSVKNLIYKFSGPDHVPGSPQSSSSVTSSPIRSLDSPIPSISVTPPLRETKPALRQSEMDSNQGSPEDGPKTQKIDSPITAISTKENQGGSASSDSSLKTNSTDSERDSVADSGMGSESDFDSSKLPDSPASEEEPSTAKVPSSNHSLSPKHQLFLSNEFGNGLSSRDADGPPAMGESSPRVARWESTRIGMNHYRGSLESLASRDWDTMSERLGGIDSPPRAFNSPYTTTASMDYSPLYRMSEYKTQGGLSPATSELNLFGYNSRSTSPVLTPTLTSPRPRFSTYDSLRRRMDVNNTVISNHVIPNHMAMRSASLPNKRDYIEELTKQLNTCQKRNQFLEAESVEMDKERNQIRFEMRGLLVNNEDLLRGNTQLSNEIKKMTERMMEMERENQAVGERYRSMEIELKEARDMMIEANTQEYAFNFLQQSLKNKIQDSEESLEKQTQHAQSLAEKLWLTERQLEELEVTKETRDKKTTELTSTVIRMEAELAEALQASTQAGAELNLQRKLYEDVQLRVEELQESLLEKDQELQRAHDIVNKLQGEVSGRLIDKERTLEEEIQLREKMQLQWKQADRKVDDLQMELQTANQARDDLAKQLKQAQEKMIDLESDLEELHDSEQRWASKHKRSIEQTEQLQMKLIQEKDLSDQLECEKNIMERQLRELRLEVEELHNSKVQEDVISKAESRAKELENSLRAEERNKVVLTNTVSKLERKINELSDQMEEEHKMATEQKDLMTQRIRSLKRQLNEAEEETSRKEAQYRHTHRELTEERETSSRLQRQLLDQHLQMKRKESNLMRQTLDNLRLDLSVDEDEKEQVGGQMTNV